MTEDCLSTRELEVYVAHGRRDPVVGRHVAGCPSCRRKAREIERNLPLFEQLRRTARRRPADPPNDPPPKQPPKQPPGESTRDDEGRAPE